LNNKPAARNDHTAQADAEPALNCFALKPLALRTFQGIDEDVITAGQDHPATIQPRNLVRAYLLSSATSVQTPLEGDSNGETITKVV